MKKKLSLIQLVFIALLVAPALLTSCGETKGNGDKGTVEEAVEMDSPEVPEPGDEMKTVVDIALDDLRFSTLEKGLKSAQLVDILEEMDSLTLFAPINEAFEKLPEEKVGDLMAPQGQDKLVKVLKYHTVNGIYDSESLKSELAANNGVLMLETLEGSSINISMTDDGIVLRDDNGETANLVDTDLRAERGVVHSIDAVMLNE